MEKDHYTEHKKMEAAKYQSKAIGEFLEWLEDTHDVQLLPDTGYTVDQLLAQYFKIDLKKVGEEKRAMLKERRKVDQHEVR